MGNTSSVSEDEMSKLQEQTGFKQVEIKKVLAAFQKQAKNGEINKEGFRKVLASLKEFGVKDFSSDPFVDDLFDVVDKNKSGLVDVEELVTGISLICKGTAEEKVDLMFKLWDTNHNGVIDKDEFKNMLFKCYQTSFRALLSSDPVLRKLYTNETLDAQIVEPLAIQIANQLFPQIDKDNSGEIDKKEFTEAFKQLADPNSKSKFVLSATLNGKKSRKGLWIFLNYIF